MKKCVLAFSGGLDTSYCAKYLTDELELEVYSVLVNVGGFNSEELVAAEKKAYGLGVKKHIAIESTKDFYQNIVRFLLYGNVLKNGTYPLSVSAERIHQALAISDYANQIQADYIAHGSTGAGNDQVRFDLIFQLHNPGITVLTPIRDQKLSREKEIEYLKEKGVEIPWDKAKYSINKGLWGTSVGGSETLTSSQPLPEEAWPTQISKTKSEDLVLNFNKGELTGIDGEINDPVNVIQKLQERAGSFGIGRDVHVGDTIIGIKGRVGFEAASPLIAIKAHHLLEKHVLAKWQQYWKQQLGEWYGMMLHEGQYLDPVMRNIESFLESTQEKVTGKVFVRLYPHRFELLGIESKYDLMQAQESQYGEMNEGWTGEDVKGFTRILANSMKQIET